MKLSITIIFIVSFLFNVLPANAGEQDTLRFSTDGMFKIVQFTDQHFNIVKPTVNNEPCKKLMAQIIDVEQPNLVIFTGDLVSGTCKDNKKWITDCLQPVIEKKVNWAITWGNHDDEGDYNRKELMEHVVGLPYSLCQIGSNDIHGVSNYVLEILHHDSDTIGYLLYLIDSNARTETELGGEDWIRPNQIAWYRNLSNNYKKVNSDTPLPALAFFHIPIPEFNLIWDMGICNGHKYEQVCCPKINSGFFAAALEQADIKGIFVGHDHANDYEGTLCGIKLCYGRVTGYRCYAIKRKEPSFSDEQDDQWRGARVILLKGGSEDFQTWIRTSDNRKVEYSK